MASRPSAHHAPHAKKTSPIDGSAAGQRATSRGKGKGRGIGRGRGRAGMPRGRGRRGPTARPAEAGTGDGDSYATLGNLVSKATKPTRESGYKHLDEDIVRRIKAIAKKDDLGAGGAIRYLMQRMTAKSAEVRYMALVIIGELFQRSRVVRAVLVSDLKNFMNLSVGHDARQPLPGPPTAATALRQRALALMEEWNEAHGDIYKGLRAAYRYLREGKRMKFPELQARAARERQTSARRKKYAQRLLRTKYFQAKGEIEEQAPEIETIVREMQECFAILVPVVPGTDAISSGTKINTHSGGNSVDLRVNGDAARGKRDRGDDGDGLGRKHPRLVAIEEKNMDDDDDASCPADGEEAELENEGDGNPSSGDRNGKSRRRRIGGGDGDTSRSLGDRISTASVDIDPNRDTDARRGEGSDASHASAEAEKREGGAVQKAGSGVSGDAGGKGPALTMEENHENSDDDEGMEWEDGGDVVDGHSDASQQQQQDDEEEEGQEDDDEYEGEERGEESLRTIADTVGAAGLGNSGYELQIEVPIGWNVAAGADGDDTELVVSALRERYKVLTTRLLPLLSDWIQTLSRVDVDTLGSSDNNFNCGIGEDRSGNPDGEEPHSLSPASSTERRTCAGLLGRCLAVRNSANTVVSKFLELKLDQQQKDGKKDGRVSARSDGALQAKNAISSGVWNEGIGASRFPAPSMEPVAKKARLHFRLDDDRVGLGR